MRPASIRNEWHAAKRIVVKIGSALLVDHRTNALNETWLKSLIEDLASLHKSGREIILVSSGAIAIGRKQLNLPRRVLRLEENQAAAAVGQVSLAHAYQNVFAPHDLTAAQILLTLGDTETRRRYLNARDTMTTLLSLGVIPVVNENDTVATSEIRYGDNDRLAARVATMMSADCLVLLSDIDGLYSAPPTLNNDAEHIAEVNEITPDIEAMAGDVGTELSRGGMVTKITAAKIATAAGTHMVICSGKQNNPIAALEAGAMHTWFHAQTNPLAARKRWIAGTLEPSGTLTIDAGAQKALESGKSLLPAGITDISGNFDRGDAVIIASLDGTEIARGLTAYSHTHATKIMGKHSDEIADLLDYAGRAEIVHRDDMIIKRHAKTDA